MQGGSGGWHTGHSNGVGRKKATTSQQSPLQDGDGTTFIVSPAPDVGEEDAEEDDYLLPADHCSGPDAGLQLDLIYTGSAVPASPPLCCLRHPLRAFANILRPSPNVNLSPLLNLTLLLNLLSILTSPQPAFIISTSLQPSLNNCPCRMTQPGPSVAITGTRRPLLAHPDRLHSVMADSCSRPAPGPSGLSTVADRRSRPARPASRPISAVTLGTAAAVTLGPAAAVSLGPPQPCTRLASAVHPTRSQHTIIICSAFEDRNSPLVSAPPTTSSSRPLFIWTAPSTPKPRLRLRSLAAAAAPPRCRRAAPLPCRSTRVRHSPRFYRAGIWGGGVV